MFREPFKYSSKLVEQQKKTYINQILEIIPNLKNHHSPHDPIYKFFETLSEQEIEYRFSSKSELPSEFYKFGDFVFPFREMGDLNSLGLFRFDELIVLSFYWQNRKKYKNVLDIGANIGLHSIILEKCGFNVRSFEPDPITFEILKNNLNLNQSKSVKIFNKAISDKKGKASFVRLCGNIAGSHLSGDKPNPYGKIETFEVDIEPIVSHLEWADFAKIDVEGHEKVILLATEKQHWEKLDAIIEIGNPENGRAIFEHMSSLGVSMYPQKINWEKAKTLKDLPDNYKEGNVFLSSRGPMLW